MCDHARRAVEPKAYDDSQKQDDIYLSGLEPMPRPDLKGKKNARPSPKILRRQKWHKTTRGPRAALQVAA